MPRLYKRAVDVRTLGPSRIGSWPSFLVALALLLPSLNAQEPLTIDVLAASRSLWPREVTVNVAHQVPLLVNGKVSGSMQAAPGRIYPVVSVGPGGVTVNAIGSSLTFPPPDTDVLARAEAEKLRLARLEALMSAHKGESMPPVCILTAPSRPSATPLAPSNKVADRLNGKLVSYNGGGLKPFEASALRGKKYLAVYFSASWCGPCREFTPQLVDWYKQQPQHDKFEVIFVSRDNSKEDMIEYMKKDGMPWPALTFAKANQGNSPLEKYEGDGIPCLVVVDQEGKVLSHSFEGKEYVGPSKVIKDLQDLLAAE